MENKKVVSMLKDSIEAELLKRAIASIPSQTLIEALKMLEADPNGAELEFLANLLPAIRDLIK